MNKEIPQHIIDNPEQHIPKGYYCYTRISYDKITNKMEIIPCPFYDVDKTKLEQLDGYCHYLKIGDWEFEHFSLLWDQCKECGINMEEEDK